MTACFENSNEIEAMNEKNQICSELSCCDIDIYLNLIELICSLFHQSQLKI